ncbi:putative glycoside hydrolase [Cohnella terricola]|uniref:GTP-binding protein n=1 Tax=Cohnella terricola TaxID=1289167 RepID=A0A559J572_9BACL|nr:putative glycoside hydrolase [Cohnella terricola]TVX94991.1 GTP-binding protein [Cohnella terricola]
MKQRDKRRLHKLIIALLALSYAITGCMADTPNANKDMRRLEQGLRKTFNQPSNPVKLEARTKGHAEDSRPVSLLAATKPVRAIYVSSHVANSSRMSGLIELVNKTELNAMVLDFNSGIALTIPERQGGKNKAAMRPVLSNRKAARQYREVIRNLKRRDIYLIARIVTFKNPELANAAPSWAIRKKNGTLWKDRNGTPWIDPYSQESWEYPLALAELAARLGFDEVQYDYVRFPENAKKIDREVQYANPEGWTKEEAIRRFLHRANHRAHQNGIRVSADVFGMVGSSNDDMGIGQKWGKIAKEVDVISPMIYPSHYSKGMWGIRHPDLTPGPIVKHALQDAIKRNRRLNEQGVSTAKIRPWLQGFTAGWIDPHQKYGEAQIREQIVAARHAGLRSYMLWNSSSRYPIITT